MADWLKEMQANHDSMTYRQDLPGFGEPQDGFWDGFQGINTDTKSGGIIGVFKQQSYKNDMWVTVNSLDPKAEIGTNGTIHTEGYIRFTPVHKATQIFAEFGREFITKTND